MPYCRCPHCGAQFHLNVAMPENDWRKKRGYALDKEAPVTCLSCFKAGRRTEAERQAEEHDE